MSDKNRSKDMLHMYLDSNAPQCYSIATKLSFQLVMVSLKCLWIENCFSLVLKCALKNTRFQSLRSLGLKLTIFQAFTFVRFYPQKWYLNRASKIPRHNRSRNMADKKEKRQRKRYGVAGTPNQQSCFRNRWTWFLPYSLTCQQETVTAQINLWHQSDVTAWSFYIKLDPFPWPFWG